MEGGRPAAQRLNRMAFRDQISGRGVGYGLGFGGGGGVHGTIQNIVSSIIITPFLRILQNKVTTVEVGVLEFTAYSG